MFSRTTIFTALTVFLTTTLASPALNARTPARYRLQTKVVNGTGDYGSCKDGLWVAAYHTGAGLNDAVLLANETSGVVGYLNGTEQLFDLGDSFPYYMVMGGDVNYAEWEPVQINTFDGVDGFSFNATGLQWDVTFGGWLACDWFHGFPQLFWLYEPYQLKRPASCSIVDLFPVAA